MKKIVITGSTRGIGYGLAKSFLEVGSSVVISGRSTSSVDVAVRLLKKEFPESVIVGQPCDVSQYDQVEALWSIAHKSLGGVDIWINNAGIGHASDKAWELPLATTNKLVAVDLMGVIYGSQVALRGMLEQGYGQLYNMEGFGSDGRVRSGMSIYGSTKRALRYFTRSLIKETKNLPVQVGALSPGIVITDFIMDMYKEKPEDLEKSKKVFNILGDKVETVAPWLANKVIKNNKSGKNFVWLTPRKAMYRFMKAGFNKRDLFVN